MKLLATGVSSTSTDSIVIEDMSSGMMPRVANAASPTMKRFGFEHPLGDNWRGYQDIDPAVLPRERIVEMLKKVDTRAITTLMPCGTPKKIAGILKGYVDAGMRLPKILDYGGMAGLKFGAKSARKVRDTEDELLNLVKGV